MNRPTLKSFSERKAPMIGVRLRPELRDAVEKAAQEDRRSLSAFVANLIEDVANERGWIRTQEKEKR